MRDALISTLIDLAEQDERVWLLYADVGYNVVEAFCDRFPERSINCGIREQLMVGMAAGLARTGHLPYCYTMSTFLTRKAYEQIAIDVCEPKLPVTLIGVAAPAEWGYSHATGEDAALMYLIPSLRLATPNTDEELEHALREHQRPLYVRVSR